MVELSHFPPLDVSSRAFSFGPLRAGAPTGEGKGKYQFGEGISKKKYDLVTRNKPFEKYKLGIFCTVYINLSMQILRHKIV